MLWTEDAGDATPARDCDAAGGLGADSAAGCVARCGAGCSIGHSIDCRGDARPAGAAHHPARRDALKDNPSAPTRPKAQPPRLRPAGIATAAPLDFPPYDPIP